MTETALAQKDERREMVVFEISEYRRLTGKSWETVMQELAQAGIIYASNTYKTWLQGGYDGDAKLTAAVEGFLASRGDWRAPVARTEKVYETMLVQLVYRMLKRAANGNIEVLTGASGDGKTEAILKNLYAGETESDKRPTPAVRVDVRLNHGERALFQDIAAELGIPILKGWTDRYIREIVAELVRCPRVIVLDDAQNLSTEHRADLMFLYDAARLKRKNAGGMFWIGTDQLEYNLRNPRGHGAARVSAEQLLSRVHEFQQAPGFDPDATAQMVEDALGQVPAEVVAAIKKFATLKVKTRDGIREETSARRVNKLLAAIRRISKPGAEIDVRTVDKAKSTLLG